MSYRQRDTTDEIAGCAGGLFLGIIGAVVLGIAAIIDSGKNTIHLPNKFEKDFVPKDGTIYTIKGSSNPIDDKQLLSLFLGLIGLAIVFFGVMLVIDNDAFGLFIVFLGIVSFVLAIVNYFVDIITIVKTWLKKDITDKFVVENLEDAISLVISKTPQRYLITLPKGKRWEPELAHRFFETITATLPYLSFDIVIQENEVHWEIVDWRENYSREEIQKAAHTYYPDAELTQKPFISDKSNYPYYRYILCFKQAAYYIWPLSYVDELKEFDPLVSITQISASLEANERIVYSLTLSDPADYAYEEGKKMLRSHRTEAFKYVSVNGTPLILGEINPRDDVVYRNVDVELASSKLNSQLHQCILAVQIESPHKERVQQLANLDLQVWQFGRIPYNAPVWIRDAFPNTIRSIEDEKDDCNYHLFSMISAWIVGLNDRWKQARMILSPAEMGSFWHLPNEMFNSADVQWSGGKQVAAPREVLKNRHGSLLGLNNYAGKQSPIRLPDSDRDTHMYVVGKTGVGKSNLLHHIIHQDIKSGKGVAVIDPHGKLVQDILRCSIPAERENDVVLIDFSDTAHPPPLNPFSVPDGVPKSVAVGQILGVLKKIYADAWSPTRMESALYAALVALLSDDHPTPRDISRIFLDAEYRQKLLEQVTDPVALEYWHDEYELLSPGMQKQTREPVLHRIRIFYRNPIVRNMVCHPHRLDFNQIIREGKIFLATLEGDEVKSEVENLGAMLIANFQMAVMSKAMSDEQRKNYYLFVDEVQQFITTSLPVVLSEARKYGLSLTIANQFLGQLQGSTQESVLGNVGTKVIFSCSPKDARELVNFVKPEFNTQDLVDFDRFHAAVKMQLHRKSMPAFSMNPFPPILTPDNALDRERLIRQKSIDNYTPWTKAQVETWFSNRYPYPKKNSTAGEVTDYEEADDEEVDDDPSTS